MSWLKICGQSDPQLEQALAQEALSACRKHNFELHSLDHIKRLDRGITLSGPNGPALEEDLVERLRMLSRDWEVDISGFQITSHRKIIGPLIVAVKRIVLAMLKGLLKNSFDKQRNFNAQVVEMLAELSKRKS